MAARVTRELFLQIGGSADGLTAASKAGRTALLNMGTAAENVAAEVQRAFDGLGKTNVEATAKDIERTYQRTFDKIRQNAQAALSAPSSAGAAQILNAAGSEQAAAAAARQAAELRTLANASAIVAQRAGEAGVAERALAVAFETQAVEAERSAVALRNQANILGQVASAAGIHVRAGQQVTVSAGQQRAAMQQLGFQLGDISQQWQLNTPLMVIFAQQGGQVIQALQMMTNKTEGFLGFLAGPWGAVLSAATVVAVPFVAKLIEGNDELGKAVEALRKEADQKQISAKASDVFAKSAEGVRAAIEDQTAALDKAQKSEKSAAQQALESAKIELQREVGIRRTTAALLERAILEEKIAKTQAQAPSQRGDVAGIAVGDTGGRVAQLEAQLAENKRLVDQAQSNLDRRQADVSVEQGRLDADPIGSIREKYKRLIDDAKARAIAEHRVGDALRAQTAALEKQRDAEIRAEQKRQSDARGGNSANRQFGREIDVAQATAIAESIGGRVTSGYRSNAKQQQLYADKLAGRHDGPVAKPGTSAHETGGAIDIAFGPGITVERIKKAYADAGVKLRQVLREEGQKVFHVEFGKKGPSQESIDKREQAAREKAANDDRAYQAQLRQAQDRVTRANVGLADTVEQRAISEGFGIENARIQRNLEIEDQVKAGKIDAARGEILTKLNDQASLLEAGVVKRRLAEQQADRALQIERQEIDDKITLLQLQGDLATNREDRKRIALQILDYEQREARAALTAAIAKENDPKVKAALQGRLDSLGGVFDLRKKQIDEENADPLERYYNQLQRDVGDMNDALKGVEADGLKSLEEGLAGLIDGSESVGSAFKKMADSIIADLIRIGIQKAILGLFDLFGFGGGIPGFGEISFADGRVPGFANGSGALDGNVIRGPGTGRSDSILALLGGSPIRVSNGESIMTEAATRRYGPLLQAMNDNDLPGFANGRIPDSAIFYPKLPSAEQVRGPQPVSATVSISIDATGADAAGLARVEQELARLRAELPGTIVSTVREANGRGMLRG